MNKMANTKKTTARKTPDANAAHARRLALLNDTQQDVCERINDATRSYTTRAIRAHSVADAVVEAGFAAMEAAVADGRERFAASRAASPDVVRVARVNLTTL